MEKLEVNQHIIINNQPEFIEDYLSNANSYLLNCYTQEAINTIHDVEDKILSGEITYKSKLNPDDSDYELFTNEEIYKTIISDESLVFKCTNHYKAICKREPDNVENGVDSWYNFEDNLQTVTVCGRTQIKASILKIAAVLKEFEILSESITSFDKVKVLKKFSPVKWHTYSKIKMPLVEDRDSINLAFGMINKKEKMMMIFLRSLNDDEYKEYSQQEEKCIKIKMNFGYYFIKFLDKNTTELFACFNTNPNLSTVPTFIINNLSKDFTNNLVRDFKNASESKDFNDKYQEKINSDKDFYDLFKKQIGLNDEELQL